MRLDHPETLEFIEMTSRRASGRPHYTRAQRNAIARLISLLARPLTAGVAGEAGSGKSVLINALLGGAIIPVGGVGRLRPALRVRYGDEYAAFSVKEDGSRQRLSWADFERASAGQEAFGGRHPKVIYVARGVVPPAAPNPAAAGGLVEVCSSVPLLRQIEFVEIPVSSGAAQVPGPAARNFARVDFAIWTTPANQAWKRSESQAWLELRLAPQDRAILAATLKDGLAAVQDQERLLARLMRDTASDFAACHLVSAQQAFQAYAGPARPSNASLLENSGLPRLQGAIQEIAAAVRQARLGRARAVLERIEAGKPASFPGGGAGGAAPQAGLDRAGARLHSARS
jgi:hypothetical protein